jgi:uncharacterized membrane protein
METTMALTDEGRRKPLTPDAGRLAGWDSLYIALVPLPAVFMSATLVSDILYWVTARALWAQVSEWLLGAGLATGAFAAADGLIRYVASGRIRPSRVCWMHVVGNMLALLLSLSNLVYRLYEDRGDAVVPAGIGLTAIVVCLVFFTARLGSEYAVESADHGPGEWEPLWDDVPKPAPAAVPEPVPPGGATSTARPPVAPRRRRSPGARTGSPKSPPTAPTQATRSHKAAGKARAPRPPLPVTAE